MIALPVQTGGLCIAFLRAGENLIILFFVPYSVTIIMMLIYGGHVFEHAD